MLERDVSVGVSVRRGRPVIIADSVTISWESARAERRSFGNCRDKGPCLNGDPKKETRSTTLIAKKRGDWSTLIARIDPRNGVHFATEFPDSGKPSRNCVSELSARFSS